jgi:hypothetical protein
MPRMPHIRSQLRQMKELMPHQTVQEGRHVRAIRPPSAGKESGVMGAPAIYDNVRFPHMAKVLCMEYGFTNGQMAKVFGVSIKTVDMWTTTHDDFKAAVRAGRDAFDSCKVENALLKIALGYEFEETTSKAIYLRGKTEEGVVTKVPAREITKTIKHISPNAKAIQLWLTNRNPDRWKMTSTVNASITSKTEHTEKTLQLTADLGSMDSNALRALRDILSNQAPSEALAIENKQDGTLLLDLIDRANSVMDDVEDAEYTE